MFDGVIEAELEAICGADMFNSVINILTMNPGDASNRALYKVWTLSCNIHESIIIPVATMLMLIYFIIGLVDKMTSENFTWEQLFRQMCMLLVSYFLIDHALDLMALFYSVGLTFVNEIDAFMDANGFGNKSDTTYVDDAKKLLDEYQEKLFGDGAIGNFFAGFVVMIFMFIPFIAAWGVKIAVIIICYTRLIELFLRTIFAPVALADFFHQGFQGAGWRYLKNYLAVSLQGAVILCIAMLFSALISVTAPNDGGLDIFGYIGMVLAFTFSGAALMFKSLSFTKELLGTG